MRAGFGGQFKSTRGICLSVNVGDLLAQSVQSTGMAGLVGLAVLFLGTLSAMSELPVSQANPIPVPPRQYPVQKQVMAKFRQMAIQKSQARQHTAVHVYIHILCRENQAYTKQVIDILSTVDVRKELNKTCPRLVSLSSEKLLQVRSML